MSNDQAGKLINAQFELKSEKKFFPAVVICDVSNDQAGKSCIAQA